jgi:hypothetical protein
LDPKFDDAKKAAYSQLSRGKKLHLGNVPRPQQGTINKPLAHSAAQIISLTNFFDFAGGLR